MRIGVVISRDAETPGLSFSALEPVCAAIGIQLREVCTAWDLDEVTVEPRRDLSDGSLSYVTISNLPIGLEQPPASPPAPAGPQAAADAAGPTGEHRATYGIVYGEVRYTPENAARWSVSLSHECLEMAVNPMTDKTRKAPAPEAFAEAAGVAADETVDYLVEICDPCQSGAHAYAVEVSIGGSTQEVMVSDFVYPEYFVPGSQAGRLSFNRSVTRPLEILTHGCLSWGVRRTQKLWQQWRLGDGTLSDPKPVGVWNPPARGDRPEPPASEQRSVLRQSLYLAEPDYRLRRIPDAGSIAKALASLRSLRTS